MKQGWATVALADVTQRISSWHPERKSGVFEYIDLSSVDQVRKVIKCSTTTLCDSAPSRARQLVATGDVLVSTVRPNLNGVAVVSEQFNGATASTGFTVLRPAHSLHSNYLFHWVKGRTFIEAMVRQATGASYPAVSDKIVKGSQIPLPSLDEQRRIAAVLDHVDTLRAKQRDSLSLVRSLLYAMTSSLIASSGHNVVDLGSVADFYAGGTLPGGIEFSGEQDGYLLLKVSDMNAVGNEREFRSASSWSPTPGARSATAPAGSVVIPKRGASIGTNKKRLLTRPATLDPNLMAITPRNGLEPLYLLQWFETFDLQGITSGSSVPQLNKKDLVGLKIPLPPPEQQRDFAGKVVQIDVLRSAAERHLGELNVLFASLQARAFAGELDVSRVPLPT